MSSAQAGFKKGNGGFVIVCGTVAPTYRLLDLYEAEFRYHLTPEFAPEGNEFQRAQVILDRFARLNPARRQLYRQWLQDSKSEMVFLDELNIVGVPDIGVTYIPDGCSLRQMIVQVDPTQFEKRFTIDRRLWNNLNVDHRAAAIVHEIIYREAISFENQHSSSQPSRLLNAFLHSGQMKMVRLQEWLLFLQGLGFHRADAHGVPIRLNSFSDEHLNQNVGSELYFYDQDHVSMAQLPYKLSLSLQNRAVTWYHCDAYLVSRRGLGAVEFHPNGRLKDLFFGEKGNPSLPCPEFLLSLDSYKIRDHVVRRISAPVHHIQLNEAGNVTRIEGGKAPLPKDLEERTELYRMLAIYGDQLMVYRSFSGVKDDWRFSITLDGQDHYHLENKAFDEAGSFTATVVEGSPGLRLPNNPVQDIY
jgi:hypothetical protein